MGQWQSRELRLLNQLVFPTGYCTHEPPCLAPGRQYQCNLRLWGAQRISGYLNTANVNYMGPANQWDANQQWLFEWVLETLLVHH